MAFSSRLLASVFTTLLALVSGCCPTQSADTTGLPPAGVVRGVVKFEGVPPKRRVIDAHADPATVEARRGRPLLDPRCIVAPDGGLADVLVYISEGAGNKIATPPPEAAIFQFIGSEYVPHVQAILAGQTVRFINRDNTLHNASCTPKSNPPFNIGQPEQDGSFIREFRNPELSISIKCDVHPWEEAILHVMKNRYFAITRPDGSFEVTGLPPGEYELSVVHAYNKIAPDTPSVKINMGRKRGIVQGFVYRQLPRK